MVYIIVILLSSLYAYFQYTPFLRERWFWLAAPMISVLAHSLFAFYIRQMQDQSQVFNTAFWYWQICAPLPFFVLPFLLYGVKLTPMCIAGIALVAIGVMLFHLGGGH